MEKRGSLTLTGLVILIVINALFLSYYLIMMEEEPNSQKMILISSITLLIFILGILVYWRRFYPPNLIRKKLKEAEHLVKEETLDPLKEMYAEIYELYLKLSEKKKQNFYGRVIKIRELVEEQLHLEKKMEEGFHLSSKGLIKERKKAYDELYHSYKKMTTKSKRRHYPRIVQIRENLERGRI